MGNIGGDVNRIPRSSELTRQSVPSSVEDISADQGASTSKTAKDKSVSQDYVRGLNSQDVRAALLDINKPITPRNQQIVRTLLSYGVEISADVFDIVDQKTKGEKKGNVLESSVISYAKGLVGNDKSISLISQFLSHNVEFSKMMKKLQVRLASFQSNLSGLQSSMDPSLLSGIASFIGDFVDEFKKMKKQADKLDLKGMISTESSLVHDLKYLQEFMKGIHQELTSKNNLMTAGFRKVIERVIADVSEFHDVLLTQLVLSKNPTNQQIATDFFHYWLIPNPMATAQRDIELMISKDPINKTKVNPEKAKIVIKCETGELGDVTIVIEIDGREMVYRVYSSKEITRKFVVDYTPDLKKSMKSLDYDLTQVHAAKKFVNVTKLLLPVFQLDDIKRVSTEA